MDGQPGAAAEDTANAIIATLNALRASVEELRQSTAESQRDIIRLREGMQPQNVPEQSVQPAQRDNTQAVVAPTDSQTKLYDLPVFSGNVEDWPLFFANFNDTTENFGYSHRQNLMRLQKCLVGPDKEAVAAMLIYPSNVPNVISELEFRFGRPDILVKFQISKLQNFPPIADNKPEQIVPFSSRVRNVVAFLKSANCQQHLANVTLLEQMVGKLPHTRQFDWAKHAATIQPYPSVEHFSEWLSELARIICLMPTNNTQGGRQTASSGNHRRLMHIERPRDSLACYQCSGNHMLAQCESFKASSIQERWDLVKAQQLFFSCLRKGHSTQKCRSRRRCNISGCQRYHNQLLHNEDATMQMLRRTTPEDVIAQPLLNCQVTQSAHGQLFKILPVNIYGPKGKREILAMFDEGSSISIMEEEVAKMIGAQGGLHPLTLQWYDNNVVTEQSHKISIEVENCATKRKFLLKEVYTVKNLNLPEQSMAKENFQNLRDLPIKKLLSRETSFAHRAKACIQYQQLHDLVHEYFTADSFRVNPPAVPLESDEDQRAREILRRTTRRVGKQYETGLLWRTYPPKLPNSKTMAEKRLLTAERQMKNDAEFGARYRKEMAKYVSNGYARKLSRDEAGEPHQDAWYLPHFAVINRHKPEKTRIVFDAAAAVSNVSLNSKLMKGPEQAQPLIRILLQFRQGRVAVSADIREMFSRIKIRAADQHAQRYLWRDGDASKPVAEYVMTSLIFGAVCLPCIAEYIKNKNAEEYRAQFPDAATTIINKHYVDDLVASFDTPEQAISICSDIVSINSQAGFELRNFVSNCEEVEDRLNHSSLSAREVVSLERNESVDKVLGLFWNTSDDVFEFHTKFHRLPKDVLHGTRAPTKRELLRIVMSVFDPFDVEAHLDADDVAFSSSFENKAPCTGATQLSTAST
ncbi:uncharacterized protein LOC118734393 [Rhagoletis pomonella]|uniref:uncharacterized protein LOC118734393 n=1 Tax=Rhagoletis pomonella TaxID=28610 RepID=UPI0017849DB6|nr:uncharacterized protein LOC118734393 [Rhagoletis pomonella]